MEKVGARKFSAQCSDNAGNTRRCREKMSEQYPWMLNMSDPSHHLHLTGKDMGEVEPINQAIKVASRITCHFAHATANRSKLNDLQRQFGITQDLESLGNTRFLTSYRCLNSVKRSLPAIKRGIANNVLDLRAAVTANSSSQDGGGRSPVKTNLRQYLDGSPTAQTFETQLGFALAVLQPLYRALTMIEARSTTPADIFLHWIFIAHVYRIRFSLFGIQARAEWTGTFPDACIQVLTRLNNRFREGVHNPAWNIKIYRDALFLHPGYHGSRLLDGHMNQRNDIAQSLYRVFARTPDGEGQFPDANRHIAFSVQLSRYFAGHAPYNEVYTQGPTQQTPRDWWERLRMKKGNEVKELADVAIKIFSVKPSSLAEERFGSVMDWMMTSRRGRLAPTTLVQLMRIRSFVLHTRSGREQIKMFPINLKDVEEQVLPDLREHVERNSGSGAGGDANRPGDSVDRLVPLIRHLSNPDSAVTHAAAVADLEHPTLSRMAAEMVAADNVEFGIPRANQLQTAGPIAAAAAARSVPIDPRTIDFANFTLPTA